MEFKEFDNVQLFVFKI